MTEKMNKNIPFTHYVAITYALNYLVGMVKVILLFVTYTPRCIQEISTQTRNDSVCYKLVVVNYLLDYSSLTEEVGADLIDVSLDK